MWRACRKSRPVMRVFPAKAIESAGYGAIWHGQRSHHGVAILSRGKGSLDEVRRGLPSEIESDLQARYLEADVERPANRFCLSS